MQAKKIDIMLIATFNCNSIRKRMQIFREWLGHHRPDVVALQETKVSDSSFPEKELEEDGWHTVFAGEETGRNGVAVITKHEPDDVSFGFPEDPENTRSRLIHLSYRGHEIVNTYVPQGKSLDAPEFQFKLSWLRRLLDFFDRRFSPQETKLLLTGDLNVAPTEEDVHDSRKVWPHVCHCRGVIDEFHKLTEWGLRDVFRKHIPQSGVYTFWDYRVKNAVDRKLGWRVDHLLATPPLAEISSDCFVDTAMRIKEKPSDHAPVAARFEDFS